MTKIIKDKIRILHFIHASGVTGPGRIVYGLVDKLDKGEFACDVVCPAAGPLTDDLRRISAHIIPFDPKDLKRPSRLAGLGRVISSGKYHILHIHSGQFSAFWKIFGRLLGIPVIIYTEHVEGSDHSWIKSRIKLALHLLTHPILNMAVDQVIAVSEETRRLFIKRQGLSADKVTAIHNGVYTDRLRDCRADCHTIRERLAVPEGALLVGVFARLSPEKGHRFLINAAAEILKIRQDVRFIIVGEGPARKEIEDLIESKGLKEYFRVVGFRDDAYDIMSYMDIIVQPSIKKSESFGLTVVEAMAKSRPVIASDIACFKEIVDDGLDGLLFTMADAGALRDKLTILLDDRALRQRISLAAQRKAIEKFDIALTARRTGELYKRVLASKGYMIEKDVIVKTVGAFISETSSRKHPDPGRASTYDQALRQFIDISSKGILDEKEAVQYLDRADNLIVENFINYIDRTKCMKDLTFLSNVALFRSVLKRKPITSKDYDERIMAQSLEFQIDNYYEPKDKALKARVDIVLSHLQPVPGEKILDVGCGVGTFAYHAAKAGAAAYGADYSDASIDTAKKLADKFGILDKIQYKCCDVCRQLPYPNSLFDKITAADFIEHITTSQKEELLSEMVRVLKPDGEIIIFTPNLIRENIGAFKSALFKAIGAHRDQTRLHYGLTDRFTFERMLKKKGLKFKRFFYDVERPCLAGIPMLNELLSLDILWVIRK